jgi:hypothetical protein
MFAFSTSPWPTLHEDPTFARERVHRAALAEARMAAEMHGEPTDRTEPRLADRIRQALGLTGSTVNHGADCATCGA